MIKQKQRPMRSDTLPAVIRVGAASLSVGCGADAGLRLVHPDIAPRHAELRWEDDRMWVRNLAGHFGVRVNGVVSADTALQHDDVVSFGSVAYEMKGVLLLRREFSVGVEVKGSELSVRRAGVNILSSLDFTVRPDTFVGILGASGAGKTTLLKTLSGSLAASSGDILFNGDKLSHKIEAYRATMGYVPQDDVVYTTLTARENLSYALRLRNQIDLSTNEHNAWVGCLLERLGISAVADRPVGTLSGGERKRVNIAVELLTTPTLLLLDEPTSGLDPASEASLMRFLRNLAHRGTTVVCTTHVMESISLFDRVMVMGGGRILGDHPAGTVLKQFRCDTFVQLYEGLKEVQPCAPVKKEVPLSIPDVPPISQTFVHRGTLLQVGTQVVRGFHVIGRDRFLIAALIGQPLVIGFLINLSQVNPGSTDRLNILWTFATVAVVWLGLNNTAREIIRDRSVYVRERRNSLSPESYLLAKMAVFSLIGLGQVLLLIVILRYCTFISSTESSKLAELAAKAPRAVAILWLTYLSAMFLGLLISTLAPSQEVAVAVLPLVVLPQLLFTGVATNMHETGAGAFNSLDTVIANTPVSRRGVLAWLLEITSLAAYTRPALVFLMTFTYRQGEVPPGGLSNVVTALHLTFLLVSTLTMLCLVFRRQDRRWMEER